MAGKRKRSRPNHSNGVNVKRQRISRNANGRDHVVRQSLLPQYYPKVFSLREYLLSKLPPSSKIRRKKILSVGRNPCPESAEDDVDRERALADLLDKTLIGVLKFNEVSEQERLKEWTSFSQRADTPASTLNNGSRGGGFYQSEIIDFAIWLLFSRAQPSNNGRVQHLLCQGYRKDISLHSAHRDGAVTSAIPGILSIYPNCHVTSIKASPWPQVLMLMGKEGERVMIDLILDCGIFLAVESGLDSYYQLSGHPLGELPILTDPVPCRTLQLISTNGPLSRPPRQITAIHKPGSINFVRNRILYAHAASNAKGAVRFGLRHIHILNRCPYPAKSDGNKSKHPLKSAGVAVPERPHPNTIQVMMYIFPRQFCLHNVFTFDIDPQETVQPFKDYTLREDEINARYKGKDIKIPKRLRGEAVNLVRKLQIQHSRCPYKKLLDYYCPISNSSCVANFSKVQTQHTSTCDSTTFKTQESGRGTVATASIQSSTAKVPDRKPSMMAHATPLAMVSAYCRAVLLRIIPNDFWGRGEIQVQNAHVFYRNIDRFIRLRRFETLSLHEVLQGMKVADIEWLAPPRCAHLKTCQSDLDKRLEIFHEFIYYIFDSILIPLVQANFHVTESNVHRYQLFYFRHDVWRSLVEPALASLKLTMFEEVKLNHAQNLLNSRTLGFSQVRLLPKETGVRPIMNLRRRTVKGSKRTLGSSINSVLAPIYNVLTFEKVSKPDRLGSALFSVGDLYQRLKSFKSSLGTTSKPLYFVKVDVKSAFDSIPQKAVVELMSSLPSESEYRIAKHAEIKPGEGHRQDIEGRRKSKPLQKWTSLAKAPDDFRTFKEDLEVELAVGKKNTVFVESVVNQFRDKNELLQLLEEHIYCNLIKIGKKFYRQREGIPQGSVLSSLLCSYFYADLEAHHLTFLQSGDSLLLRLIDDFLLITTNRVHAKKFLQVMHDGLPEYGVGVNADKTLTNFEATINGRNIAQLVGDRSFPYCGNFINTVTLNIKRDRQRRKDMAIEDSLTVEFSKTPGKTFHRKVLNTFKIQSHAMFLDTSFNSLTTVLSNVYSAFKETATKMWTYARCLPVGKRPGTKLLIKTISEVVELAFVLMKSKSKNKKNVGYKCALTKMQVEWLATNAFRRVLLQRQSKYRQVIEWLDGQILVMRVKGASVCDRMEGVVRELADDS